MIHDLRIYTPHEGKADALRERFLHKVLPIFARLGIEVVQIWQPETAPDELWYVTRFADEPERQARWEAFKTDAEWLSIKAASEADGPLLKSQTFQVLHPVPPA